MSIATTDPASNLFGAPANGDRFAGIADPEGEHGREVLRKIAAKIARTAQPEARSDIPAGATSLAQLAAHDLDFLTPDGTPEGSLLDLAVLYGDGPRHDAFAYQVPARPGAPRHLLRIGRTRTTATSPAWGAARDLPRASCPHHDKHPADAKSEVKVPNTITDSKQLLGQMQVRWALLHKAIASRLAETRDSAAAFVLARRINRGIYRDAIRADVLGTWLHPDFRDRYAGARPEPLLCAPLRPAPREFMDGVGRLGHALVREIYSLNDQMPVVGLRNLIRHTGTGRPHEMPLTEDWLVDFGRFFAIDGSEPQTTRALGPHVARPFGDGPVVAVDPPGADGLVLRDLRACARGALRSVRSLIERADGIEPGLFNGFFAQDKHWQAAVRRWLADTGLDAADIDRLAEDPPLTLFLMLEAEEDAKGKSLGALGSVIMGETIFGALPLAETADKELADARTEVFGRTTPATMEAVIRFLQGHYKFTDGARLHAAGPATTGSTRPISEPGVRKMLDTHSTTVTDPIPRIEVADYIELGKLVAEWSTGKRVPPTNPAELKEQLRGIAEVPDRITEVEVVQGTLQKLVIRLPVREMVEQSLDLMDDPMGEGSYPFPQFYSDYYSPGFGPVLTPRDILYARVGDYTIAQCR
jgi:hypothetical protein